MGWVCEDLAQFNRAMQLYEEALSIQQAVLGREHVDVGACAWTVRV